MPARDNSMGKLVEGTPSQPDAETLFRTLVSQNDPARMAARYILAVMLERKGLLRRKTATMDAGRRVEVFEDTRNGEVFRIADPGLQLEQLEAVQREVADLLEHGLPPANAESVGSSESRPATGRRRGVSECKPLIWFWPLEFGTGESDAALQALAKGDAQSAITTWRSIEGHPTDGVVRGSSE